ncbi:hypothetical protein PROFUN_02098 [Planoprotostelium fungivorum]|uniref:Oxysterol-binding protein n=1 Tax=Planoprotostelium fungivorum TaxID=1890364 RepID=A0A2P6NZ44_9EUKA|nr:hypothetical protein PROFUN_02098 [Planoprotostelium fungivorum]
MLAPEIRWAIFFRQEATQTRHSKILNYRNLDLTDYKMVVQLFLAFLLGMAATLVIFRHLAQRNRTLLYQLLTIDTSFIEPPMGKHGVRENDTPSYTPRETTCHCQPLPMVGFSIDNDIIVTLLDIRTAPPSMPEIGVSEPEPNNIPAEQTLYNEQSQLPNITKRRPRNLSKDGFTAIAPPSMNAPVTKVPSNSELKAVHSVAVAAAAATAAQKHPITVSGHTRSGSHSGTPATSRLHSSGNHSEEEAGRSLSLPQDKRGAKRTPILERHASSTNTNAEQEKLRRKQVISNFYAAESTAHSGWVEIGSIMAKKLKWKWRFIVVQGGWIHYYKDDERRGNNCCGWVILSATEVYERPKKPGQIVIKNVKGTKMFHRHGPDPSLPPAKKDGFLFGHRKSAKCRIRIKDKDKLEEWLVHLKRASATKTDGYISSDDEDDILDDSEDNASFKSSDEEVVLKHSAELDIKPSTPNPTSLQELPPARRINRADSIIIVRPDAGVLQEVPAPREFSESRRNTLRYSLIGVSSPVADHGPKMAAGAAPEAEALNAPAEEELLEDSVSTDNREGLGKILAKAIGLDLTTIALPVTINEPQSFLQRMCEATQYYDLLNKADEMEDPNHRMTYVAAFAATSYSCSVRTTKPFNPYLGETFELVRPDGYKFLGEQVSHHPPIGACNATSPHFDFFEESGVKSKFGGNSLNIETIGMRQLTLKKFNDHYTWSGIKTTAHNILLGEMWVDHYGRAEINCPQNKTTAILEFTKCGWFSKGRYEVKGWIVDSKGKTVINLEGKWVEQLEATVLSGPNFPGSTGKTHALWKHTIVPDMPDYKYKFTSFCREMNKREGIEATLPTTDSRLRKDRIALEELDIKKAGAEKRILEERERRIRKQREQKGVVWKPKYFVQDQDNAWAPINAAQYWAERQQRIAEKGVDHKICSPVRQAIVIRPLGQAISVPVLVICPTLASPVIGATRRAHFLNLAEESHRDVNISEDRDAFSGHLTDTGYHSFSAGHPMTRSLIISAVLLGVLLLAQSQPQTLTLQTVIHDYYPCWNDNSKAYGVPYMVVPNPPNGKTADPRFCNPDIQPQETTANPHWGYGETTALTGMVNPNLDTTTRKPVYIMPAVTNTDPTHQVYNATTYSHWWSDSYYGTDNIAYNLTLTYNSKTQVYEFASTDPGFFPIDNQGWGNDGLGKDKDGDYSAHNWGFCVEAHVMFLYDANATLTYEGDDDLWIFFNNQLAFDLGGLHTAVGQTQRLGDLPFASSMRQGGAYNFDLFYCERESFGSDLKVSTTMNIFCPEGQLDYCHICGGSGACCPNQCTSSDSCTIVTRNPRTCECVTSVNSTKVQECTAKNTKCSTYQCQNSQCVPTPIPAKTHGGCTNASCDPAKGWSYTQFTCPSNDTQCFPTTCSDGGSGPAVCTATNACPNGHNPCVMDNVSCKPMDACHTVTCVNVFNSSSPINGYGVCVQTSKTPQGDSCTSWTCDPTTGALSSSPARQCNDPNNLCDTSYCDPSQANPCQSRMKLCDDNNACTDNKCNPTNGTCYFPDIDFIALSENDTCTSITCDRNYGIQYTNVTCRGVNCQKDSKVPGCCTCGLSPAVIAGISAGAIAGAAVGGVAGAAILGIGAKKGYDFYAASQMAAGGVQNNPMYVANQQGECSMYLNFRFGANSFRTDQASGQQRDTFCTLSTLQPLIMGHHGHHHHHHGHHHHTDYVTTEVVYAQPNAVVYPPAPVMYPPPVYAAPPVYGAPPPVYGMAPPVAYVQPPVAYVQPTTTVYTTEYGHGHHHGHHGHHGHHHGHHY